MQVQLIVANEQNKGQVIPVNVPSFMIGRAEGCNLRSHSSHVSRFHCVINVSNGSVVIQDLGGGNGTVINGQRISSNSQPLKDGDKLDIGTHSFIVSIKLGLEKFPTKAAENFELASSVSKPSSSNEQSKTRPVDPNKATAILESVKKPSQEAEVIFEIRLDGQRVSVTKTKLFELARQGSVHPDDLVTVAGTKVFADSIQGITFGNEPPAVVSSPIRPAVPPTAAPSNQTAPAVTPAVQSGADPFAFSDLGNIGTDSNPFGNIAAEPHVRIAKKESAVSALWNALDISFSRVYTMEGNNLVIHSIKALYYVLVMICFLWVFFVSLDFCTAWYKSGVFLDELNRHAVGLATTLFGGITIIVIVRVLLEMLLLAWLESGKEESKSEDE